jgi:hypothetical protein
MKNISKNMFFVYVVLFLFASPLLCGVVSGEEITRGDVENQVTEEIENPAANILLIGKVTETFRKRASEYTFSAYIGPGGYKIRLFDSKQIEISSAYSDYKDTLTYNAPGPVVFGTADLPPLDGYTARIAFSPTPYPFSANNMLQAVWLTVCANKTVMDEVVTKYPPGVVFTRTMLSNGLDWKEYSIDDIIYSDSQDQALLGFVLRRPESVISDKKSLIEAGIPREAIEKLETPSDGSQGVVLPLGNGMGGSLYCKFSTTSRFPDNPFSKETLITWYGIPNGDIQPTFGETKASVEAIEYEDQNGKISPDMPYSSFRIVDYRFKGITNEPLAYGINNAVLPFYGTESYKKIAQSLTGAVPPEGRNMTPRSKSIIFLILFIAFSPFIFLIIRENIKSK